MAKECFKEINNSICDCKVCTGCSACMNICPQNAITMKNNEYDEIHPFIDINKCIGCNLCKKVCPNNETVKSFKPMECYASIRKDNIKRKDSSSGGICAVLYEKYIEIGNIVYGVKFNREEGAKFYRAENIEDIIDFKGSKYVQANMNIIYKQIEKDIIEGKKVLFIGTPCQVAGVKSYFNMKSLEFQNNLATVDFLCHGCVPNKYLLDEITTIEKKNKCKCDTVSFRSNDLNKNYYLCLKNNDKVFYRKKAEKQRYFYSFLHSITIRECCVNCKYKQTQRMGDITLGDFLGLGVEIPFKYSNIVNNPSLVLVNTKKGDEMLKLISDQIELWKRPLEEAVKGGPSFRNKNGNMVFRKIFRKKYPRNGFVKSINHIIVFAHIYDWIKKYYRKVKKRLFFLS